MPPRHPETRRRKFRLPDHPFVTASPELQNGFFGAPWQFLHIARQCTDAFARRATLTNAAAPPRNRMAEIFAVRTATTGRQNFPQPERRRFIALSKPQNGRSATIRTHATDGICPSVSPFDRHGGNVQILAAAFCVAPVFSTSFLTAAADSEATCGPLRTALHVTSGAVNDCRAEGQMP